MPKSTSSASTNSLGIRYVVDGPPGLKTKLNEIIRSFDYLFPRSTADIIPTVTPEGARYALRDQSGNPRTSASTTLRLYTQALTVAGIIPTNTEISTALVAAYTAAATTPRPGDIINLTVSSVCKLRTTVTATGTASGLYVVTFTVSSVVYYGNQVQTGLY